MIRTTKVAALTDAHRVESHDERHHAVASYECLRTIIDLAGETIDKAGNI